MKQFISRNQFTIAIFALVASLQISSAQDIPGPLTIQGLDQFGYMSARARAMGGTTIATGRDVTSMFGNPATLTGLSAPELRLGGYYSSTRSQQRQEWVPNRFYGGLSLMFEDLLDDVQDPTPAPGITLTRADSVQRPYDDLGPNWKSNTNSARPSLAAAGLPFSIGDIRLVAGLGFSEVANLNSYYQNNNVLSPNIGLYRPSPIPIVRTGDSLKADWFQYIRQREGTIQGITPAVSVEIFSGLDLGASTTILFGSSDDFEQQIDRGKLTFFYDKFRSDRSQYKVTRTGTSNYKGVMTSIGGLLQQETYSLGVSVRLPLTITRDWDRSVVVDSAGTRVTTSESGSDKMKFPLMVMLGVSLHPSAKWEVCIDYEIKNLSDAQYSTSTTTTNPWLSSQNLRLGVEFRPGDVLTVRGGYRTIAQVIAPAGSALIDDPIRGAAYSAGVGLHFDILTVDLAYEYSHMKYEDVWQSNVNYNTNDTHTLWLETGIRF